MLPVKTMPVGRAFREHVMTNLMLVVSLSLATGLALATTIV